MLEKTKSGGDNQEKLSLRYTGSSRPCLSSDHGHSPVLPAPLPHTHAHTLPASHLAPGVLWEAFPHLTDRLAAGETAQCVVWLRDEPRLPEASRRKSVPQRDAAKCGKGGGGRGRGWGAESQATTGALVSPSPARLTEGLCWVPQHCSLSSATSHRLLLSTGPRQKNTRVSGGSQGPTQRLARPQPGGQDSHYEGPLTLKL